MDERVVIKQLQSYKRIVARMRVLEKVPIGYGMSVGSLYADDNLQELHKQLRKMPTYMYLTKREQELETVANVYLTEFPYGTKAQLHEVRRHAGADVEDDKLLRELERKIKKVIEARAGRVDGLDAILERLSELQDLEQNKGQIDNALSALEEYKPEYARLLRLRYVEGLSVPETYTRLSIVEKTYFRWRVNAVSEYAKLSGL